MDINLFLGLLIAILFLAIGIAIGRIIGIAKANAQWRAQIPQIRQDAAKRSRAVLKGHFSEQLAPYLPDFPFHPSECMFLGRPIDLVVFKGLEEKSIKEVVFVEVKTGKSRLTPVELSLKTAVEEGRVSWEEYRPK